MKNLYLRFHLVALILLAATFSSFAQGTSNKQSSPQLSPEEVIRRFTNKESELFEAWKEYAYQQETKLQVLGPANTISGEFYQLSEFVFSDAGKRMEHILKAPPATLDQAGLTMTQEDRNAFVNLQPFALTAEELPNYQVTYVGKEKLDDLNTYVFDVAPKAILDTRELKRMRDQKIEGKYFKGRIWVDDVDYQIVKTAGKIVPEFKQRFLKFETYRENIDGKFWFPTYTYGDDELVFDKGPSVHVRNVVRYKNYRRFSGDVKFKEILDDVPPEEIKDKKETGNKPSSEADTSTSGKTNSTTSKSGDKSTDKTSPPTNQTKPKKP